MPASHFDRHTVRFQNLYEKLCAYSDFIQLDTVPYEPTPPAQSKTLRNEFEENARNNYWRWVAYHNKDELKLLGCDDYDLGELQLGKIHQQSILPALIGYNIDHIRPIFAGGTNDPSNLGLLPIALHNIKSRFENVQTVICPERTNLQVVRRKLNANGVPSILPFEFMAGALRSP